MGRLQTWGMVRDLPGNEYEKFPGGRKSRGKYKKPVFEMDRRYQRFENEISGLAVGVKTTGDEF